MFTNDRSFSLESPKVAVLTLALAWSISQAGLAQSPTIAVAPATEMGAWDGVTETAELSGPYEDPRQQDIPFGWHSYFFSPWRAYMDTRTAQDYLDSLGFNSNAGIKALEPVAAIMSEAGFCRARIEYGWGRFRYDDPTQMSVADANELKTTLQTLQRHGIRPLLLLNAHHSVPCPHKSQKIVVKTTAIAGASSVFLSDVTGLQPGYSGLTLPTQGSDPASIWMADTLITRIDPATGQCDLSRPLPVALSAGEKLEVDTLKYHPFSGPVLADGTPNPMEQETLDGWRTYVGAICRYAKEFLSTDGKPDAGFDLEVWNEMTFGSNFLQEKYYYDPPRTFKETYIYTSHDRSMKSNYEVLLPITVDYVNDPANGLMGVHVVNGFSNQRPWDNGQEMWPGQYGFSRHYYTELNPMPIEPNKTDRAMNASGTNDPSRIVSNPFMPDLYRSLPESWFYAYQTEFVVRDTQPFPSPMRPHYRFGHPAGYPPAKVWMTEFNTYRAKFFSLVRKETQLSGDDPRLHVLNEQIAAKDTLRAAVFQSHKGIAATYFFAAKAGELGFSLIDDAFYNDLTSLPPTDSQQLTDQLRTDGGLQMQVMKRLAVFMRQGQPLEVTRPLRVEQLIEHRPRLVFKGNGTPGCPDHFNRDDFAVLPYQFDATTYAVGYYVVTRDSAHAWNSSHDVLDPARYDFPPQTFDLTLGNLRGTGAKVTAWDPMTDRSVPVQILNATSTSIQIRVESKDYPRFLTIQETAPGPLIQSPRLDRDANGRATVTFDTNLSLPARVTWGRFPDRTDGGAVDLPASLHHAAKISSLAPDCAVHVEVEADGLKTTWPRWPYDVAGTVNLRPPAGVVELAAAQQKRSLDLVPLASSHPPAWCDVPSDIAGLNWKATPFKKTATMGEGNLAVDVSLENRQIAQTDPEAGLPELSTLDTVERVNISLHEQPVLLIKLKLDAAAHPGETKLFQRYYLIATVKGIAVLSFEAETEEALKQAQPDIDKIANGLVFFPKP